MRKIFILIAAIIFIVGCSDDSNDEVEANADETTETKQATVEQDEAQGDPEAEKELYLVSINNLMNEYEEEHEIFTHESGTRFYDILKTDISENGLDAAINSTENLIGVLSTEEQEVFGSFLEELIEIEENFSHLDWSD